MILGIDVGLKNLGVCVVDDAKEIKRWAVWDSAGSWAPDVHTMLVDKATDDFLEGVTRVVIERQPSKNPSMVRIMHYLEFYFVSKGLRVAMQDSKNKLLYAATTPWFPKDSSTDCEWTYRFRKKLATQTVAAFVRDTLQPLAEVFENSKKKDDLADAVLHALAYGTFAAVVPERSLNTPKPKKVVARAPTDRQRRTGKLSASNVKHLLRECTTPDDIARECKNDKTLARCLKKHYGDAAGYLRMVQIIS